MLNRLNETYKHLKPKKMPEWSWDDPNLIKLNTTMCCGISELDFSNFIEEFSLEDLTPKEVADKLARIIKSKHLPYNEDRRPDHRFVFVGLPIRRHPKSKHYQKLSKILKSFGFTQLTPLYQNMNTGSYIEALGIQL